MRHRLEYAPVWLLVRVLGALPRRVARAVGITLGWTVYVLHRRLRKVGRKNLALAFPEMPRRERARILRGVFTSLGRLLAEFCRFPKYTKENIGEVAVYDGFEHFDAAEQRGKGVLLLTAHLGGWELGSFMHSVHGHPHYVVVRNLDNPYLDALVRRYRTLYGNQTVDKDEFARGLLAAMRAGKTVGILMDTNMTPPQGVFVPFFGVEACTASGVARVALRTGAAVVPAFSIWDARTRKYRVTFHPALELTHSGDDELDAVANTALFTRVIEEAVRKYPEQWLWVHRRWKTRPEGDSRVY